MLKLILSIAIYLCIPIGSFILPLVLERSFLMEYSLFSDYLITPIWIVCAIVTVGSVIAYAELYQRIVDMLDKYIEDDEKKDDGYDSFNEIDSSFTTKEMEQEIIDFCIKEVIPTLKTYGINSSKEANEYYDENGELPIDNVDLFSNIIADFNDKYPDIHEADIMDIGEDYIYNNDW